MNLTLLEKLAAYSETDMLPMHMPGHKRKESFDHIKSEILDAAALTSEPDEGGSFDYLRILNAHLDITEITGFDDLHNPTGILKEGMELAASLYGCDKAYYLINGTTAGILSGIKAVCEIGDEIVIAANCHKSVYHAIELLGLKAHYIIPERSPENIFKSISPKAVGHILEKYPASRMVVLTSPTYEGVVSDIESIANVVHDAGKVLMVDAAHGAHFGFNSFFPENPIRYADLTVISLHKTMPSLTQTALLLCNRINDTEERKEDRIERALDIFQTSSPSYLLMASIDSMVRTMKEHSREVFESYIRGIKLFYEKTGGLKNLRLLRKDTIQAFDRDEGRIVVLTEGIDVDGFTLSEILRTEYGIESEMSLKTYVIFLTGAMDDEAALSRLAEALISVDMKLNKCSGNVLKEGSCEDKKTEEHNDRTIPEKRSFEDNKLKERNDQDVPVNNDEPVIKMDIREALAHDNIMVTLKDCPGRIAAEYIWAYPPGIPLVFPGKEISSRDIEEIRENTGRREIRCIEK